MLRPKRALVLVALIGAIISIVPSTLHAQATVPVTTVVTVLGPKYTAPPALTKDDILVTSGKKRLPVTGWEPAQGGTAPLQLAILIDNSVSPNLGLQFNDIKSFITQQPRDTAVGLFYAQDGIAQPTGPFSTDHDAVAKKLHLTFGRRAGASPSIYLSVSDLVKRWPMSNAPVRREMLVITSGVDILQPGVVDTYLDSSIEDAQKHGIVIHSIYAGGNRLGFSFRGEIAQSNLGKLTSETGGEVFSQGLDTPISFAPYLNQLDMILRNQYWLTFTADRSTKKKGEVRPINVRTEQHNAVISAPKEVFVPGP